MITLFRSDTITKISDLKAQMAGHIRQLPAKIAPIGELLKIFRLELRCEPMNILAWLHNQKANTKIYWSEREGTVETGGIGIADGLKGSGKFNYKEMFDYMDDRLSSDNPRLRYYGGVGFNPLSNEKEWEEFGTYQFVVPQFEFIRSNRQTIFAFNIALDDINPKNIEHILAVLEHMDFSAETKYRKVPQILARADVPDRGGWNRLFKKIHEQHNRLEYEKIVFARRSDFEFNVNIRPDALIKHLKDQTPECFHYCFQFFNHLAYLGATPERLYKRKDRKISSEAMAGTRPRGADEARDSALANELLNSTKDAKEHKYVVDAIQAALAPLCKTLTHDPRFTLKKWQGSQHLVTRFEGELDSKVIDHHILSALHPTPAVAGYPIQAAVEAIIQLEPFNRGWYAGPVGYVGYNEAEFAVAIRSGLVQQNKLSLFAGAGIVSGSTAQAEWDEIENKIGNFIKVFNSTP